LNREQIRWSFFDEREKIELHADKIILAKMQSLLWDAKKLAAQTKWSQSIEQTLQDAFESGELSTIEGKSYLVYDIETSYATNDLKWIEFYLWYAYIVEWGNEHTNISMLIICLSL
jgi:hypothetical protein